MGAETLFHPNIRDWFGNRFGMPTQVQASTWPRIAAGAHVLATAPTGSGKTLAAFLWSLDQFARGTHRPGCTRVLYVSPLKALNNDIQRNLLGPLGELREHHGFPEISVRTRSGDTSQGDRQRMLRHPPEILITTPESLTLLLTNARGRQALATVETLILDEVHAVAANRRGVQLMTSVERLAAIAGEFQRIALSATVKPLDAVAAYIGGYRPNGAPRSVEIIAAQEEKAIGFSVRFPENARNAGASGATIWDPLSESFRAVIAQNRSTLFFTNSRRLAEKMTLKINEHQDEPLAYAHHGSLAREIRSEVEGRLKVGSLRAIVATSSLELGIDIGDLDEVVLVQSPPSVAAALQRIGRAGHRVGEVSKGTLYPTHAQDFLEAAALAGAIAEQDIEPLRLLKNPLDVLCQTIVSMCATETWIVEEMFNVIRTSHPYHDLPRAHFDLVLDMLAGRYAGARVRELRPRIAHDRINGTVRANKGALFALYNAGGTIPNRGYFQLRHADSATLIGELDEEFVWEASVGQTFNLGTQNWRIERITHNDVLVRAAPNVTTALPFWRAESHNRSFHFSSRIAGYLERAERAFDQGRDNQLKAELQGREGVGFDRIAADELIGCLRGQRQAVQAPLPHRHHLLLELVRTGPGGYRGPNAPRQLVMHTFWGGAVNRPWALALEAAWRERFDAVPEIHADNNAVVVQLSGESLGIDPEVLTEWVTPDNLDALLRASLEGSGHFGARFRECAGRALLLTRQRFNERLPLWMSRMQAKKLMTATRGFRDFPILLEAWRTCLVDEFDLPALRLLLGELRDGTINYSLAETDTPSPFASMVTFDQLSRYMYADDTPEQGNQSALGRDLIEQAVGDESLRPRLRPAIIETFEAKRQRRADGYRPQTVEEWLEWAKERVQIPLDEWAAEIDHEHLVRFADGKRGWIAHLETAKRLIDTRLCPDTWINTEPGGHIEQGKATQGMSGIPPDDQSVQSHPPTPGKALAASGDVERALTDLPDVGDTRSGLDLAREILSFYGPRTRTQLETLLPNIPDGLLTEECGIVAGQLVEGSEAIHYCDVENLQTLLRFQRAANRAEFTARPLRELSGFWAAWQRLEQPWSETGALSACEQLSGYAAPVQAWLHDFLACRFTDFADHRLDECFTREQLTWRGAGNRRIALGYPEEISLLAAPPKENEAIEGARTAAASLFVDRNASYGYHQISDQAASNSRALSKEAHGKANQPTDSGPRHRSPQTATNIAKPSVQDERAGLSPQISPLADVARASQIPDSPGAMDASGFSDWWWGLVWRGIVAADDLAPLRAGVRRDFRLHVAGTRSPRRRARVAAQGWPGNWRLVDAPRKTVADPLERLEDDKERVRVLAERYGVVNREIVNREYRWAHLFRAIRIMEMAGELIAGHFFEGLSGPQFITPRALHRLRNHHPPQSFWMNATDCAAPCGLTADWPELPRRMPGNYLSFFQGELALVIENLGARLMFHIPPDHPDIDSITTPLQYLARRHRRLAVVTINGENARRSPYLECLDRTMIRTADHRHLYFEPR